MYKSDFIGNKIFFYVKKTVIKCFRNSFPLSKKR